MAWAEAHQIAGAGVYAVSYLATGGEPNIIPAVALSILSHYPLDDLNVGSHVIYHGIGETKAAKIICISLRVPVWCALICLYWNYPMMMACALPAWLAFDWEHLYNWVTKRKKKHWLHAAMWLPWLKQENGLLLWWVAYALFLGMCL